MTITASGFFGPTLEKMFINTSGQSMEAETHKCMLVNDTYAPDFDAHDFRNDVTNEVSGTGYSTGGTTITTTEWTLASPSAGVAKWDHDDPQWSSSSIPSAMAAIDYFNVGSSATDQLLVLLDFVTAVTTSNGLFLVSIHANGVINLDYTP